MDEVVALGCVMDEADWNDSDDVEDVEDETGCEEQYKPLDIAQMEECVTEISHHEDSLEDDCMDTDSNTMTLDVEYLEPVCPVQPYLPGSTTPLAFFMLMVGPDFLSTWLLRPTDMPHRSHQLHASYKWENTYANEMV